MNVQEKPKVLEVLPADPTRVKVETVIDASKVIGPFQGQTFTHKHIPLSIGTGTTTRKYILAYLAKIGFLVREKQAGYYSINHQSENALLYFHNLSHHRFSEAYACLRKIILKDPVYGHLESVFGEKKSRYVRELVTYFKEREPSVSYTTIDRKIRFLCDLLNTVGLAQYNPKKKKIIWKRASVDPDVLCQRRSNKNINGLSNESASHAEVLNALTVLWERGASYEKSFAMIRDLADEHKNEILDAFFKEKYIAHKRRHTMIHLNHSNQDYESGCGVFHEVHELPENKKSLRSATKS